MGYGWASTSAPGSSLADTKITRDGAAGIIAQVNGTNAQELRIYNTDNGANDEFASIGYQNSTNVLQIASEATGTGTVRDIEIVSGAANTRITKLAGTGTRAVVADAGGNLSASTVVSSGTFTPAFTNVTNITSSTPTDVMYHRIGSVVTVSGLLSVTPTATGLVELRMSLPIASALTAPEQVAGPATNQQNLAGHIAGDDANDAAMFRWIATGTTSFQFRFTYTYQIL
jgi:hypothetical protein